MYAIEGGRFRCIASAAVVSKDKDMEVLHRFEDVSYSLCQGIFTIIPAQKI